MKKRMVVCILMVAAASAAGAQTSWSDRTHAGEYSFARGNFARAEAEFQAALDIAKSFPEGDKRLETSLFNLGRLYEHDSNFDQAQPLFELLLAAREHRLGPDHAALLEVLFAVARVSQPTGDYPTVASSLRRYAEIVEATGGGDARQNWQALQMLARMEVIAEADDKALDWQRMAASMVANDPSATDEEKAMVLESTANLEITAGDGVRAEEMLIEVAELRMAEGIETSVSATLVQGAATAFGTGNFETAERLAEGALADEPDATTKLEALKVLADTSWAKVNRRTDDVEILLAGAADDGELATASERLRALNAARGESDIHTMRRLVQVEALRARPESAATWQRRVIQAGTTGDAAMSGDRADLVTLLAAAGKTGDALAENATAIAAAATRYGESADQVVALLEQRVKVATEAGQKKEAKKAKKMLKKIR